MRLLLLLTAPLILITVFACKNASPPTSASVDPDDSAPSCGVFSSIVEEVYLATVDENHKVDVVNSIALLEPLVSDDPPMHRAWSKLMFTSFRPNSDNFHNGIIAGRQIVRLCTHRGHDMTPLSPDVIMEYACGGPLMASMEDHTELAPILAGQFLREC